MHPPLLLPYSSVIRLLITKPVIALLLSGYATLAIADMTLYQNDTLTLSASISSALGSYFSGNTRFGAGRLDFFSGENTGDAHWAEGYLKPGLFKTGVICRLRLSASGAALWRRIVGGNVYSR